MKLTITLEHCGRTVTKQVESHGTTHHIDVQLQEMIAECERPSPGERMRQLFDESRRTDPVSLIRWDELGPELREKWEELARLARLSAERGEL